MTTDHSPQADHRPLCVSPISPPLARSRPNGTPRQPPRQPAPELLNCACGGLVGDSCDGCGIPRDLFLARCERLNERDEFEGRARAMTGLGTAAILLGIGLWIAVPEYAALASAVPLVLGGVFVGAGFVARAVTAKQGDIR